MALDFVMARYEEMVKGKKHLPFKMDHLTDFMVTKAKEELNETEESKPKAIIDLRRKLDKEDKLVCPKNDDYLLQYLRARKFNVSKAFQLMQNYHKVKKSFKDIYDTYDPDLLQRLFAMKAMYCMPYRDTEGCAVFVIVMRKWDPDIFSFGEVVVALTIVLLRMVENPPTQVCGVRILLDVKDASFKQVRCITPRFINLLSKALRNTLPIRFKGIYVYNENIIFQYLWSVLKLFLSDKIRNRFQFLGDNQKNLHKLIPKTILPAEYGGDYPLDGSDWFNSEIEHFFEKYGELTTYGYKD